MKPGLFQPFFQLRQVRQRLDSFHYLHSRFSVHGNGKGVVRAHRTENLRFPLGVFQQKRNLLLSESGHVLPDDDNQIGLSPGKLLRLFDDFNALQGFQHIIPAHFAQ